MTLHTRRRARCAALTITAALLAAALPSAAHATFHDVPRGFRVAKARVVAPGVVHLRLEARHQRIHVAQISPGAGVEPLVAVARGAVTTGRQRTSTMCARRGCLVGVNGDFYYSSGRPAGAVVIDGEPWITRRYDRPHLVIGRDGTYRTARITIPLSVRVRYRHELEDLDRFAGTNMMHDRVESFDADALNTPRESGALVVYTHRRGGRTGTASNGVELIGRITSDPERLMLRGATTVRVTGFSERGNSRLERDTVVLSGRGARAKELRALWSDIRNGIAKPSIRVNVGGPKDVAQVIGGRPELLRDGRVLEQKSDWFSRSALARSIVGWRDDGTLLLVTIDGGGRARGMSLERAAWFMRALGATDALNLDGGGSTTFVRRGVVTNQPRWGSERAVATALLVVRAA
jgi:hypothetical protein